MIIGISSEALAGDGVEHRAGQKAEANKYEQNVEHARALPISPDLQDLDCGAYEFERSRGIASYEFHMSRLELPLFFEMSA